MSDTPICPCDDALATPPTNLPGLSHIAFRVGTFREFRRALLTPGATETELSTLTTLAPGSSPVRTPIWRPGASGDLGVMMMEWAAYIADVLTFYNERIANQNYLRTADLPESVPRLIRLLGYRPRPAIGATGTLAARVTPGQTATLPKGLQFQSKPVPGQEAQTFELDAATTIGSPDAVPAAPPVFLLQPIPAPTNAIFLTDAGVIVDQPLLDPLLSEEAALDTAYHYTFANAPPTLGSNQPFFDVLLQGAVTGLNSGTPLLLAPRDPSKFAPLLATVVGVPVVQPITGGKQTVVTLLIAARDGGTLALLPKLKAADVRLQRAGQQVGLWTFFANGVIDGKDSSQNIVGTKIQLASLVRQLRAGDPVVFTVAGGAASIATTVLQTTDVVWFANASPTSPLVPPAPSTPPLPVPHTQLQIADPLATAFAFLDTTGQDLPANDDTSTVTLPATVGSVAALFGWVDVGVLKDQPPGPVTISTPSLEAVAPAAFVDDPDLPIIVADTTGTQGFTARGGSSDGVTLSLFDQAVAGPTLPAPVNVLYDLLPVSRGKTVPNEILGSGDASQAGQSFQLSQSPVTYKAAGSGFASTVIVSVAGRKWTEVKTFFGAAPTDEVFVTREDESGKTHVDFGDGINGARLPTGTSNVVATYRIGAGATSPAAGKLTIITQAFPGLRAVLNPVAVGGGADPDAPSQIAALAPRSVLAFGRAVSVFDYQALVLQTAGVTRAQAVWSWNDAQQRASVTVFVGDDLAAVTAAQKTLATEGDPNRPVFVELATALEALLRVSVVISSVVDLDVTRQSITGALTDPTTGLFAPSNLGVGQAIFNSQIEQAILAVDGVVAVSALAFLSRRRTGKFLTGGFTSGQGSMHSPGEGAYFTPSLTLSIQVDNHG